MQEDPIFEEQEGEDQPRHHKHPGEGHGPGPKRPHAEVPPHILRELMDMKEKIGKLEGMMEVLLKKM